MISINSSIFYLNFYRSEAEAKVEPTLISNEKVFDPKDYLPKDFKDEEDYGKVTVEIKLKK